MRGKFLDYNLPNSPINTLPAAGFPLMLADELLDREMFQMPWKKGATQQRHDETLPSLKHMKGTYKVGSCWL